MEKKTKIILLSVLVVSSVAYLTRDKWMPTFSSVSKISGADGSCGCEDKSNIVSKNGLLASPVAITKCPDNCQTIQTTSGAGCRCLNKSTGLVSYIKLT